MNAMRLQSYVEATQGVEAGASVGLVQQPIGGGLARHLEQSY